MLRNDKYTRGRGKPERFFVYLLLAIFILACAYIFLKG